MNKETSLAYRPCVGIMLINKEGKVFIGRRKNDKRLKMTHCWQMPQGGIDKGEQAEQAVLRELEEETGVASHMVTILAKSKKEHQYDLPNHLIGKLWKGKYRGQTQRWFLMKLNMGDAAINIATEHPEFSDWRWADPEELPDLIVPFKRVIYQQILEEFTPIFR